MNTLQENHYTNSSAPKRNFTLNLQTLLVSVNGLMLTAIIFFVVLTFTESIIEDDAGYAIKDVKQVINSSLNNAENTINSLTLALSIMDEPLDEDSASYIFNQTYGHQYFDHVYIFEKKEDTWRIVSLAGKEDGKQAGNQEMEGLEERELLDFVMQKHEETLTSEGSHTGHIAENMMVLDYLPAGYMQRISSQPVISAQPYGLAKSFKKHDGTTAIVAGFGSIIKIMDLTWLESHHLIHSIHVKDRSLQKELFRFERFDHHGEEGEKYRRVNSFFISIGNRTWEFDISINMSDQSLFLKSIPTFFLLFGIILTIVGTLYVYSNQKKSAELAAINDEMIKKNDQLNDQIIEKERLYQAIEKARTENMALLDSVTDIIFETDVKGTIIFLNQKWLHITGFTTEQSVGRNIFSMIHQQDQEEQKRVFQAIIDGQKTNYRSFTRLRASDGSFRAVEMSISMLRRDRNDNMRVVGMFTDIEERRRAERALSEAERKYRTIVENASGGIYQITPEGQYLSANPAMARILGYKNTTEILQDIKNANTQIYINPKERTQMIKTLNKEGFLQNFETQIRKKDGNICWINENARSVKDDEDQILYYEGSIEDISQRKRTEDALKEAKLKSDLDNRSKSEFLTNMSHELRTPLNSIIGFSEIIKDEVFGEVGQSAYKDYANDIYESGKHLLKIISDILDVSKIDAGERDLIESVVDINKVVSRCFKILEGKRDFEKLSVLSKLDDASPSVYGEELAVKQMLMSLISNAIKFTPEDGRVIIEGKRDSDGQYLISVSDTGIGMHERDIEKAISPFGQIESGHDRNNSGTGLGLTLVNSLIRLHNGKLEIFSQKGIGTTATLIFPKERVIDKNEKKKPEPAQEQKATNKTENSGEKDNNVTEETEA